MTEQTPNSLYIIWFFFLSIAPIIGSFAASFLYFLIGREIPPILPQINIQSFSQALVATFVLGLMSQTSKTPYLTINTWLIVLLFFLLMAQVGIDKLQQEATQKHVKKVLREKIDSRLKGKIDLTVLFEVAESMVDVDYLPESYTNILSGHKRREQRKQFIEIVKSCLELHKEDPIEITEDEFLVREEDRKVLNRLYFILAILSVIFYMTSIALSILGQVSP